jgi:hypothetical protein
MYRNVIKNISILVLIVLLMLSFFRFISFKNSSIKTICDIKNKYVNDYNNLIKINTHELRDIGKKVDIDSLFKVNNMKTIGSVGTFCIRIPGEYCEVCINKYITMFEAAFNELQKINILVIVNYEDSFMIQYLKKRHPLIKNRIINVRELPMYLESLKTPYVFYVGEDGRIINLHLTNKKFKERYEAYVNEISVMVNNFKLTH